MTRSAARRKPAKPAIIGKAGSPLAPIVMDWKNPDYGTVLLSRMRTLEELRAGDAWRVDLLRDYYREGHYADFINDWGVTFDPRNAERKIPTIMPFILFQRQREWIDYVVRKWRAQEPGLIEKSRDMGVTWLAITLACTMCNFIDGLAIGFGSRKAEYVDKPGTLKPILPKGRMFMENLPQEFRGSWLSWRDAPNMRISFPDTGSLITGEGGKDIGRGDREAIFFVDEAAHLEQPELVDAALSQTTNCRMDMSSVRGMANPFAKKRWEGKIEVFIFDWRQDPRKDQTWYEKQCATLDPVVVAQEIDRNYSASVKGVVIPGDWVLSAIDARKKLGLPAPTGRRALSYDVADQGQDKNAIADCHGWEILSTEEWSGVGSDTFDSTEYVIDVCDERGIAEFRYDADGIGAGVRGDARIINERREKIHARKIRAIGYRGSSAVHDPDGIVEGTIGREGDKGRTNEDYFGNLKAQAWWGLRQRFQRTHRWVTSLAKHQKDPSVEVLMCNPDQIISINSECPHHLMLVAQLSQATYKPNEVGKIIVNKTPDNQKSPNSADAVVAHYAPMDTPLEITHSMVQQIAAAGRARRR